MAYARLSTRNTSGLHPNLRGLGAYSHLSTDNGNGLSPNFRGLGSTWSPEHRILGDIPLTNFTIGPGGQFVISTATTPTGTSVWDQMLTWLGQSTIIGGMPNSIFAIGGGFLVLAKLFGGRGRR
jgi:hypothetical protein